MAGTFLPLTLLIGGALAAAAFMLIGYGLGGKPWRQRFAMRFAHPEGETVWPGWIAEIIVLGIVVLICLGADYLTPDTSLGDVVLTSTLASGAALAGVVVWVVWHAAIVVRKAHREEGRDRAYCLALVRGYSAYSLFSIYNYAVLSIVVALIAMQIPADYTRVVESHRKMTELLERVDRDQPAAVTQELLERANGALTLSMSYTQDQMNTLFLVLICALVINVALSRTAIGKAFDDSALDVTWKVTLFLTALVCAGAAFVYVFSYSPAINRFLDVLASTQPRDQTVEWSILERRNELIAALLYMRSPVNFVVAQTRELGGVVLLLALAQWLLPGTRLHAGKPRRHRQPPHQRPARQV
jgi:hypothetical protein